jgi:hypothetical protein
LPVAQIGWNLAVAEREAHSGASFMGKFENKLVATLRERRGRDHAAREQDGFVSARVNFRRTAGPMQEGQQRAAK